MTEQKGSVGDNGEAVLTSGSALLFWISVST